MKSAWARSVTVRLVPVGIPMVVSEPLPVMVKERSKSVPPQFTSKVKVPVPPVVVLVTTRAPGGGEGDGVDAGGDGDPTVGRNGHGRDSALAGSVTVHWEPTGMPLIVAEPVPVMLTTSSWPVPSQSTSKVNVPVPPLTTLVISRSPSWLFTKMFTYGPCRPG